MSKKILIFDRFNSIQFPGGDTVQINAIKSFLCSEGYEVKISTNPLEDLSDIDYIFIFNLTNPLEAFLYVNAALRNNKPYIIFPVYWNLDMLKIPNIMSFKFILKKLMPNAMKAYIRGNKFIRDNRVNIKTFKLSKKNFYNPSKLIRMMLKNAHYIIPNSYAEWSHLEKQFNLEYLNAKVKVIYNGIDLRAIKQIEQNEKIKENYGLPKKYICCVGGIGPRKNQLNLVLAANKAKVNVVIIGQVVKGYEKYGHYLKKIAGNNVYFLGQLSQQETFKVVKSSMGHIQPSYIETPGLASLEAAALGVPIAVAKTAPVEEYFGEYALYCDPTDIQSIADRIIQLNLLQKVEPSWVIKYDWSFVLRGLSEFLEI